MKKRFFQLPIVLASCALLAGSLGVVAPASAATNENSTAYKEIVAHLQEDGVPAEYQDQLAKKALSGAVLDSSDPESEPVSVDTWSDKSNVYERRIFADHSYTLTSIEKGRTVQPGSVQPYGISGCVVTTGTGYQSNQNCKVSASGVSYQASFTASYTFNGGVFGTISKATNGNVKGVGGEVSSISTKVDKSKSDGRIPASAYVKWYFKSVGSVASGTTYLYLKVTANSAYTVVD